MWILRCKAKQASMPETNKKLVKYDIHSCNEVSFYFTQLPFYLNDSVGIVRMRIVSVNEDVILNLHDSIVLEESHFLPFPHTRTNC